METSTVSDEEILRGLREHPHIRNRIASLLALAQGTSEEFRRADDAEGAARIRHALGAVPQRSHLVFLAGARPDSRRVLIGFALHCSLTFSGTGT